MNSKSYVYTEDYGREEKRRGGDYATLFMFGEFKIRGEDELIPHFLFHIINSI